MATSARPDREGTIADRGKDMFTGAMRWEIFSEEGRSLLWSSMVSLLLGIIFLLLVMFGPRGKKLQLLPDSEAPIEVAIDDMPEPTPIQEAGEVEVAPAPGPTDKKAGPKDPQPAAPNRSDAITDAFGSPSSGTGGMVGDVSNVLGGIQTSPSGDLAGVGGGAQGGKTVLGYGQGGQGSVRPGRGGIGGPAGTGGGIGGVGAGGGMTRGTVRVAAPRAVSAPELGGPGRDVPALGDYVRSRQAQLQSCYTQQGLTVNPKLAGTINVAITMTGSGGVTGVDATAGSMSGAGTPEVTSCIESKIRGWRFPSSDAGGGTYSFPFSFTS